MTDEFLFISSPVSVQRGDAARVALEATNDAAHYTEGKGVLSVPLERWQKAQAYERETWLVHAVNSTDDRNLEHADRFEGYKALPKKLGDVIELGCGPFTNLRLILPERTAEHITLLDPLADEYRVHHPHCPYKERMLGESRVNVIALSIEEWDTLGKSFRDTRYDTVIMINVLSHYQDAQKVSDWIDVHLKKGGHLVFAEPVRDIDPARLYDVGHPLSYNQDVIETFLKPYKEKFRSGNYFIGTKK
jgi:SAM-dependent methyltransferase